MTASKGIKTRSLLMELQPQPPGNRFNPSTAVCRKLGETRELMNSIYDSLANHRC